MMELADRVTSPGVPGAGCIHDLVLTQAHRAPNAVALTVGGVSTTYGTLLERAEAVASHIAEDQGSAPLVGVAAARSADTVAAMLGALIAGVGYVPLAHDLPEERVRRIAVQAGLRTVVGPAHALAAMPPELERLAVRDVTTAASPFEDSGEQAVPDDVAYVVFTSGSTGEPKGVVVEHQQIVNSTLARFEVFPTPCTAYLMLAPFTFDASAAGLYFTLAAGGRLIVPTAEEVLDPALLAALIDAEGITHLDGVPSQYAALVAFHPEALCDLRCVVVAGEALPQPLVERHRAVAPDTPLFNEYGPTEGTVWSTVYRCRSGNGEALAPIGRAIPGVRTYVVGQRLEPVAAGVTGELCVAGTGVARGYLGRAELTAERFVPDAFSGLPGARMYRTGDLVREDPAGVLHFRGRRDNQAKVRGFRVEPTEVEAAILDHPAVASAAVLAFATEHTTRLAAYVVTDGAHLDPETDLAATVRSRLPEYMVPQSWHLLDELPLTPHGKVDRRRLLPPSSAWRPLLGGSEVENGPAWIVVRSDNGHAAIWPSERPIPPGWSATGERGSSAREAAARVGQEPGTHARNTNSRTSAT